MKSWIILIVLAVAITAVATVAVPFLSTDATVAGPGLSAPTAAPEGPAPQVEVVEDTTYKFGVMAQESEGKHGWMFKNTGLGILQLKNLGTDCSCTVAQIGNPEKPGSENQKTMLPVAPGTSEPIELTWNTRKIDGAYRKSARIGTNDPRRPEVTLAVEGSVYPAITTYPPEPSVNFLTVSNDEEHRRQIAFCSKDRPDMNITRLVSSNPALIGVELRLLTPDECKSIKVEKGFAVDFTLKMASNLGSFAEEVAIETDHPLKPVVKLKVMGKVTGPITTIPEKLVLREINSSDGGGQDMTLWVRGRTSARFTVEKKPAGIEVAIEPIKQGPEVKGSKYKMSVKVMPGTPAGRFVDEIVLKTDVPMASEVRVPLDVLIQTAN